MEDDLLFFIIFGFIAQMIDGAIGMGYGVSANSFLLSIGLPPASASASVHTAEIFATGASGISHWRLGNVDKKLFLRLLVPGVLGGIIGAYILTNIPGKTIKPFISAYLLIMGIVIIRKALRKLHPPKGEFKPGILSGLGAIGGFFDAVGGGGWGPIVTTTLVARGENPRLSIGSVNTTEFFVTLAESITFILTIGLSYWKVIIGLMLGGVIAAPIAALLTKKLPARVLMAMVGVLIIVLSVRTIYLSVS
jgi:uncharacterized membrane protein YfcA